jgi:hypothetical protein
MRKSPLVLCCLLVAALTLLAGCSRQGEMDNATGTASGGKVAVSDAATGHQLGADGAIAADQKGKNFTQGEAVYLAFKVDSSAPENATAHVDWIGPNDQKVASDEKPVTPGSYADFTVADTKSWDKGDYRADISIGNQKVDTERFSVVDADKIETTSTKPKNAISDVTIGHELAVDGTIVSGKEGTKFAPGQPVIVSFKVGGAPPGTVVRVDWYGPNDQKIASEEKKVEAGRDYMEFTSKNTRSWDKADYRAEIVVNGQKVATERFGIVEPNKADKT